METKTLAIVFAAAFSAAALVACGGGGGGSSVTPPPPTDTTPPTFTLASNTASTVVVKASEAVMTAGATITVQDGNTTKSGGTTLGSDGVTLTWTSSSGDFACGKTYNVLPSASDLAGNASKSVTFTVTTAACPVTGVSYSGVIVGVRFGRPGIINVSGGQAWTEATNSTSYQSGAIPIGNGYVSEAPLADCSYLELVRAASDNLFHVVNHNLVTNVVSNYTGTLPAGYEFTPDGSSIGSKWHNAPWGTAPFSYMNAWGKDAAGNYAYTTFTDGKVLNKQTATGTQSVVYTSSDGGAFTVITSASCTAH